MHRLLERQLRKAYGGKVPPEVAAILPMIDAAYESADEDRALLDRAMEITSSELETRNAELIKRIAEAERVTEKLTEADEWRRNFLNAAAHELGTPLTPIRLQLYALRSGQQDPARTERSLQLLERNVDRLTSLVSDLLDSAKLQSDRIAMVPEMIDMLEAVKEALGAMEEAAVERGIKLELTGGSVQVVADARRLGQALDNLLSNAIKFTPASGTVRVEIETGDMVQVRIRDSGIGMRQEDLPRLFEPFVQIHDASIENMQGTGLGLYICKGIAEAFGGDVLASSQGLGHGSCFTLTLPVAA